jgi:hypothetical protein
MSARRTSATIALSLYVGRQERFPGTVQKREKDLLALELLLRRRTQNLGDGEAYTLSRAHVSLHALFENLHNLGKNALSKFAAEFGEGEAGHLS